MEQKQRLKLCPRCNAQVDRDVIICPYCDTDFTFEQSYTSYYAPDNQENSRSMTENETVASLYPPPYQPKVYDTEVKEEEHFPEEEERERQYQPFLPTLLFSIGMNLAFLGILLLFFSNRGELFLRMNAKLWILFFFSALPLILFGYRGLSKK